MSRKDRETIQIQLDCIRNNQKFIHEVILNKTVRLEQAKDCVESQLRLKQAVIEQITEERDALRKENKSLEQERDALELRLRHLLRSETVRLFDELDGRGKYRRDIGQLDTYGVHNKIKAQELAAICPRRILDTEALTAPGGKMITFPDECEDSPLCNLVENCARFIGKLADKQMEKAPDLPEDAEKPKEDAPDYIPTESCYNCKHIDRRVEDPPCCDCHVLRHWEPRT